MNYENIRTGIFRERPNRFIAMVEVDGKVEKCHVKNTGRCRELLQPGALVYLQDCLGSAGTTGMPGDFERENKEKNSKDKTSMKKNSGRKTRYDVIAVKKGDQIVNIDSQVPNKVVAQWIREGNLFPGEVLVRPEQKYGQSRFDLYLEYSNKVRQSSDREVQQPAIGEQQRSSAEVTRAYMEIKGVTLEEDGVARFPDAPTERGVKHVKELCKCREEGYEAYIFFLIQMKGVHQLEPNWKTHEAFGRALQEAAACGVHILAYDSIVTEDSIQVGAPVKVVLENE